MISPSSMRRSKVSDKNNSASEYRYRKRYRGVIMEQYKEKLKVENIFLAAGSILTALFAILAIGSELGILSIARPTVGDSHWHSGWYGYVTGASCGLFAVMLYRLVRNLRAIKDDKKLKKLYVQVHDERSAQIVILARNTAMQLLLWLGLTASVIAGYFSITVSTTILVCTFTASLLSLILVGYYRKKCNEMIHRKQQVPWEKFHRAPVFFRNWSECSPASSHTFPYLPQE